MWTADFTFIYWPKMYLILSDNFAGRFLVAFVFLSMSVLPRIMAKQQTVRFVIV